MRELPLFKVMAFFFAVELGALLILVAAQVVADPGLDGLVFLATDFSVALVTGVWACRLAGRGLRVGERLAIAALVWPVSFLAGMIPVLVASAMSGRHAVSDELEALVGELAPGMLALGYGMDLVIGFVGVSFGNRRERRHQELLAGLRARRQALDLATQPDATDLG